MLCLPSVLCLHCFDTVAWVAGRASSRYKTEWWHAGVVMCRERGADLHMAQLMPLPLTVSYFSKIQIGFPFRYQLTWVVPGKRSVKCVYMCLYLCSNLITVVRSLNLRNGYSAQNTVEENSGIFFLM